MNKNGHQQPAAISAIGEMRRGAERGFSDVLKRLRAGIQRRDIRKLEGCHDRSGRVHYIDVVEWHVVADLLDRLVPEWSYAVRSIVPIGHFAVATAAITINGVTREGIGTGPACNEAGIRNAEHDAIIRAAAKFGIARKFYRDEEKFREAEQNEDDDDRQIAPAFDPLAKTLGELISIEQLLLINRLARQARLDPKCLCWDAYKAGLGEISRRAASSLIEYLETLASPIPNESTGE